MRISVAGKAWAALLIAVSPSMAQSQAAAIDYARDVHPVLARRCFACHSGDKRSGGYSLQTYNDVLQGGRSGASVIPGASANSLLYRRIDGEVQPVMPLGGKLLSAELAVIRDWIDEGARATPSSAPARARWNPPLSLTRPAAPPSAWPDWQQPVDRFAADYFRARQVAEPPAVADARFARRAYLDVWGLLPAPEELQSFLADNSSGKRAALVARLMADNRKYADHWISFWNDLLRNDEGVTYYGERKSISAWLLPALERNLPYDQMVRDLLNPAQDGPDGFLVGVNWRGDVSAGQTPPMQAAQNSAQILLGINLKCNSCHDSFISRWKLRDAYALAAFFADEPKLELVRCDSRTGQFTEPRFLYPEIDSAPASGSLADRRAAAARMFTDPRNGRLARTLVNRVWQRLMGRAFVEPVDDMDAEPWNPELLDWLSADLVEHGYDVKRLIAQILTSRAYQAPAVPRKSAPDAQYVFRGPEVRRITGEEYVDAVGAITGEWRVTIPRGAREGRYDREWHMASTPLSRALGRPIRDQVITERNQQATTLQFLELVNGETLNHWLERAARKMLGTLPHSPASLYDSGPVNGNTRAPAFDVDISQVQRLWLLVKDEGSYNAERVLSAWGRLEFASASGPVKLDPVSATGVRADATPINFKAGPIDQGVRTTAASTLVFDLAGKGITRVRGTVGVDQRCVQSDINPAIRFFIFGEEPNRERLIPVAPAVPTFPPATGLGIEQLIDRVFQHALGRPPSAGERRLARETLRDPKRAGEPSALGLADLLWAVTMLPEFQLIV